MSSPGATVTPLESGGGYQFGQGVGATAASIFRVIDREKPTLLGDNVDTLLKRKPDLTELFLLTYTRGVKIPRAEKICGEWVTRWFDPFCPKTVTLIGTDLPEVLLGRSFVIELWKMKEGEVSTPQQRCIGWPEQKYIIDAGKKAPGPGCIRQTSGLGGIIRRCVRAGTA